MEQTFGSFVREKRQSIGLSLRTLAAMRRTGSLREVTKFLREKKPESYFEVGR